MPLMSFLSTGTRNTRHEDKLYWTRVFTEQQLRAPGSCSQSFSYPLLRMGWNESNHRFRASRPWLLPGYNRMNCVTRTSSSDPLYFLSLTLLLPFDTMKTTALIIALTVSATSAFTVNHQQVRSAPATRLEAKFDPLGLAEENGDVTSKNTKTAAALTTAFAALAASPLAAIAEEDDYEYGAVNAPVGIAWAAGVLAILTAALPVLLQSGEKALEQQRIDEGGSFGKSEDILKKRR